MQCGGRGQRQRAGPPEEMSGAPLRPPPGAPLGPHVPPRPAVSFSLSQLACGSLLGRKCWGVGQEGEGPCRSSPSLRAGPAAGTSPAGAGQPRCPSGVSIAPDVSEPRRLRHEESTLWSPAPRSVCGWRVVGRPPGEGTARLCLSLTAFPGRPPASRPSLLSQVTPVSNCDH